MPTLKAHIHDKHRLVIIDFETCNTTPDTQVLTLGATVFNPTIISTISELQAHTFYAEFKEQEKRTFSMSTIKFWMKQTREAQLAAFEGANKQSVFDILNNFNAWLINKKATHIVGNGAGFDNPILASLYKQYKVKPLLPFWSDLDLRTMRWLDTNAKLPWPNQLLQHHAADDAVYEAMWFQQIYNTLNK